MWSEVERGVREGKYSQRTTPYGNLHFNKKIILTRISISASFVSCSKTDKQGSEIACPIAQIHFFAYKYEKANNNWHFRIY